MDKTQKLLKKMDANIKLPPSQGVVLPNYSVVSGAEGVKAKVQSLTSEGAISGTTVTASGVIKTTADQETDNTEYCPNVIFTDGALPAANTVVRGTIGIVYTA